MAGTTYCSILGAAGLLVVVLLAGCGRTAGPAVQANRTPAAAAQPAVVGYLVTRGHRITLKAGGRYTIADKNGKVLASNVTMQELQKTDPGLARLLDHAVAGHAGLWAGLKPLERADGGLRRLRMSNGDRVYYLPK